MARKSSGIARIPAYWFNWYPKPRSTEFYVRVYWQCRRRGIRKSNKPDVLSVMRLVDNCDISDTTYTQQRTMAWGVEGIQDHKGGNTKC